MNPVVTRAQWLEARQDLLQQEKALTRMRDEVARARRSLPWQQVEQDYVFDGVQGAVSLAELFNGRSQLIVYHFMYGPGWQEGCRSCSFWADQYDVIEAHIGARDVSLACVSRAPIEEFLPFKSRMGWQFTWVSSSGNTFNEDYGVSFPDQSSGFYNYHNTGVGEEMPGVSVFKKEDDRLYHTYSAYSRGLDALNATYQMLDLVPDGRNETELDFPMAWIRHRDRYVSDD